MVMDVTIVSLTLIVVITNNVITMCANRGGCRGGETSVYVLIVMSKEEGKVGGMVVTHVEFCSAGKFEVLERDVGVLALLVALGLVVVVLLLVLLALRRHAHTSHMDMHTHVSSRSRRHAYIQKNRGRSNTYIPRRYACMVTTNLTNWDSHAMPSQINY